jgi:predicted Zn-dependent peptidase
VTNSRLSTSLRSRLARASIPTLALCLSGCRFDERFTTLAMHPPDLGEAAKVQTWKLTNGLRVAVLRDPRARLYSVDLRYDVGTSDDPPLQRGLALVTGEAVVGSAFAQPVADVELTTQLAVDLDRTELTTTAIDLDGALELAARRLAATCADLPLTAARKHAQGQLTGIPPSFVQAVWGEHHPYAAELGGDGALPDPAICSFFATHFGAQAATLVVTGPFGADLPAKIQARFADIRAHVEVDTLKGRGAIAPITPTTQRVRTVVWGLGKPTAAIAIEVPALGDQDDIVPELALRRLQAWAQDKRFVLHTALVGGRRGRALVVGIEAEREADLGAARDRLKELFEVSFGSTDDGEEPVDISADDMLNEAQIPDDPFLRGAVIADLVASGRRVELLRRTRAFAAAKSPRAWIRDHLAAGGARHLDLIPAVPGQGGSIEQLAAPAETIDRLLAGAYTTEPAVITAAPVLARPLEEYTLANGLRVILAADPLATTLDARVVFPAGTRDEQTPRIAAKAAGQRVIDDRMGPDTDAQKRLVWYGEQPAVRADVEVTNRTTHFRTTGFAALGDWHVFGLAWRMTRGHYDDAPALELFARHYAPKGATLIISGGFAPAALKPAIERWFGPWQNPRQPPPKGIGDRPRRVVVIDAKEADSFDLELAYAAKRDVKAGTGRILAAVLQQRLALALRASATTDVAFDSRDGRLLVTAQIDPGNVSQLVHALAVELDRLRTDGVPATEVDHAKRQAIAITLANEVSASGRARQLEDAVSRTHPATDDSPLSELVAATPDDVTDAARRLLDPATRAVTTRSVKKEHALDAMRALGMDPAQIESRD